MATVITFALAAVAIRFLAKQEKPFYWISVAAQRFALIVSNDSASGTGGTLVDVLHGVSGKSLDKTGPDPLDWKFTSGKDPQHSGMLFELLGVQAMGNFPEALFRQPRKINDRRLVRGIKSAPADKEPAGYETTLRDKPEKFIHFSGESVVKVNEADTADGFGLKIEIDLVHEKTFPVRATLRLADSLGYLESKVEELVNIQTASKKAEEYLRGNHADTNKKALAKAILSNKKFCKEILKEIGITITSVSVREVSLPAKQMEILQRKADAKSLAEAAIIKARGDKSAQMLINAADADRINTVIKPAAESELTVSASWADAYKTNKTVTTFAPGSNTTVGLK